MGWSCRSQQPEFDDRALPAGWPVEVRQRRRVRTSRHEDADRGRERIGEWRRFSGFQSPTNLRGFVDVAEASGGGADGAVGGPPSDDDEEGGHDEQDVDVVCELDEDVQGTASSNKRMGRVQDHEWQ
jgi:hypothetical protein